MFFFIIAYFAALAFKPRIIHIQKFHPYFFLLHRSYFYGLWAVAQPIRGLDLYAVNHVKCQYFCIYFLSNNILIWCWWRCSSHLGCPFVLALQFFSLFLGGMNSCLWTLNMMSEGMKFIQFNLNQIAQDVPRYMMVAGDRAELRGLNLEGLKRNGFSDQEVSIYFLNMKPLFITWVHFFMFL